MKRFFFTAAWAIMVAHSYAQVVSLSSEQLDFETVPYGEEATMDLTLTNISDEPVTIQSIEFFDYYSSLPFAAVLPTDPIPANGTASIVFSFIPIHNMFHNSEAVIKTSGNRGSVSVDLIGNCTYPGTYYSATYNLLDVALKDAFETILATGYIESSYSAARDELYMFIENQKVNGQGSTQNRITRAYIGTDAVGFVDREDAQGPPYNLNTEHTFPQGLFNQNLPMRSDLHHLMITDIDANSERGSFPFGIVESNISWEMGGSKKGQNSAGTTVFEPRDAQKGKSARALLYFVLRYENFGGFLNQLQESVLKDWVEAFPANEAEMNRNNDIEEFQGNRSPLIDYPQFADRIFSFRQDENRPDLGILSLSSENINFGAVPANQLTTYNLVLTNHGERFITITDLELVDNPGESFAIGTTVPATFSILPGESANLPITCTTENGNNNLQAVLTFSSSVSGPNAFELPITASNLTSVDDTFEDAIALAPNPFYDHVDLFDQMGSIKHVQVFDVAGRLCHSYSTDLTHLSTFDLRSGYYSFVLTSKNGEKFIRKMIKP